MFADRVTFLSRHSNNGGMIGSMRSSKPLVWILIIVFGFQATVMGFADLEVRDDWAITDKQVVQGETRLYAGNITVESGGELLLDEAVFVFNSTEDKHFGILVEEGGTIRIENSRIRTVNQSIGFAFFAYGSVDIKGSNFESIYDSTLNRTWMGGFRIFSDDPVIEDSTFTGGRRYGVRFEGCENIRFVNNVIRETSTALSVTESSGVISGNWLHGNSDRQVFVKRCGNMDFQSNILNGTGMAGLVLINSTEFQSSDNVLDGGFYVVYASGSQGEFMGDELYGDYVVLEGRDNSEIKMFNCLANVSKIQAKSGSTISFQKTVNLRVVRGGNPVENAIVEIQDADGSVVAEGRTNSSGLASFKMIAMRASESGVENSDPHQFKAVKGLFSSSGQANISTDSRIELEMKLPWLFIGVGALVAILVILVVFMPSLRSGKKKR